MERCQPLPLGIRSSLDEAVGNPICQNPLDTVTHPHKTSKSERRLAVQKPVRLGRAGQTGPGIGYGPSPAEKVGGMQWPGMAQVSKLKQKEKEDSALLGSPDDSPNQYLDTGDISPHDPREINASGGTSTGMAGPTCLVCQIGGYLRLNALRQIGQVQLLLCSEDIDCRSFQSSSWYYFEVVTRYVIVSALFE